MVSGGSSMGDAGGAGIARQGPFEPREIATNGPMPRTHEKKAIALDKIETTLASKEIAHAPKAIALVPKAIVIGPKNIALASEEIAHAPKAIALVPKEIAHGSKGIAHSPKDIARAHGTTALGQMRPVGACGKPLDARSAAAEGVQRSSSWGAAIVAIPAKGGKPNVVVFAAVSLSCGPLPRANWPCRAPSPIPQDARQQGRPGHETAARLSYETACDLGFAAAWANGRG